VAVAEELPHGEGVTVDVAWKLTKLDPDLWITIRTILGN
jgi:hypothetical protein